MTDTPPDIQVRAFDLARDLAAWTDIHNQRPNAFGTLRIPFTVPEHWSRRFEAGLFERALVAEIDDQVVGCAGFHLGRNRTSHSGSLGMAVHEDFHGRGIGTALMEAIIDLADNWYNLRRLELEVYPDNAAGVALYKKFGFSVEGAYRKFAFRDGDYVDALAMARLRPDPWFDAET
jgi:putative acetyltransferase